MDRSLYYRQFEKFQQNREKHFSKKIFKVLNAQIDSYLSQYKQGITPHVSAEELRQVLKELYIDSRHWASLVYSQLPKKPKTQKRRTEMGFNEAFIRLINDYFEAQIINTSQTITNTTVKILKEILQQATSEGRSLNWIVNKATTESAELTRNRARLIARTETVTASNRASYFAAAKTGLKMKKDWLSAGDKRVRPDHQSVNGSRVDMEDYFTVGDSRILLPGARVQENGMPTPASEVCNCRCVVMYVPVRVNGALVNFDYGLFPVSSQ